MDVEVISSSKDKKKAMIKVTKEVNGKKISTTKHVRRVEATIYRDVKGVEYELRF